MIRLLRAASRLLSFALVLSIMCFLAAYTKRKELPTPGDVLAELDSEVQQTPVDEPSFVFDYAGTSYVVEPVARFSLKGLVVSHNDITAFDDIYHSDTSVDIKDLCVIWGDNIVDDNFREVEYWSEPWTCNVRMNSREVFENFNFEQFSNNHLLSPHAAVRERIRSAHIGDQVSLEGMLVNYYPQAHPAQIRRTSTVRTDKGNGACEVVFVETFEILRPHNSSWFLLSTISKKALLSIIIIKLFLFLLVPYLEFRSAAH